jgi:hypothetical protein
MKPISLQIGMPDFAEKRLNDTAHEKDLAFLYQVTGLKYFHLCFIMVDGG